MHFAEQRAAPYSMRSEKTKRYTVDNNVRATHNLLTAITDTGVNAAIAHLGTMGVYGYGWSGSAPIPEGYLTVKVPTPDGDLEREILHPANPGSVYHMTKTLDQLLFAFYAKNDGLRITDLHQGIVWGTQTNQTALDPRLINRFDYDGDYGTVLNRFLMQAAIGHPLTVHGTGGQTRAFIHIKDTVRCIEIAISNPPQAGDKPKVLNQITETHRVLDLAKLVSDITGGGHRLPAQPAGRGGGERPRRAQRPVPRPRPRAHHAVGGAAVGGQGDRRQVRRPRRPAQDHRPLGLEGRDGETSPDLMTARASSRADRFPLRTYVIAMPGLPAPGIMGGRRRYGRGTFRRNRSRAGNIRWQKTHHIPKSPRSFLRIGYRTRGPPGVRSRTISVFGFC